MAPRSLIYLAMLLAATATAAPLTADVPTLAGREALPAANKQPVADGEAVPDIVFLSYRDVAGREALPADKKEPVKDSEAVPDIVFIYDRDVAGREALPAGNNEPVADSEAVPDIVFIYDD